LIRPFAAASLLSCLTWVASPVLAQSTYSLSTLKSPNGLSLSAQNGWGIDNQNAVYSIAYWTVGFNLNPFGLVPWGPSSKLFLTRWPASTATSVSGTKLSTESTSGYVSGVSPDGKKIALGGTYFDTTTRVETILQLNGGGLDGMTNSGVGAATLRIDPPSSASWATFQPGTWSLNSGFVALPMGSASQGGGSAINAQGDVAGWLLEPSGMYRGALWRGGQLEALPLVAGQAHDVLALNDAGLSVVRRWASTCTTHAAGTRQCSHGQPKYTVRQANGVEQPLEATAGLVVSRTVLGAQGVVVGRMQPPTPNDADGNNWGPSYNDNNVNARAYIWANGSLQDLTTVAQAKGVKLPTGAVLVDAMAINAQGSIVARMLSADKKTHTFVRLTAK
jgi:hypothetical protein